MTGHDHTEHPTRPDHPEDGYDGPAHLVTETGEVPVQVTVRGLFQPIDGRYHWHGRIARHERVEPLGRAGATVVLRTPGGEAAGRLSDVDPWGRYRIAGVGRPPYPLGDPGVG